MAVSALSAESWPATLQMGNNLVGIDWIVRPSAEVTCKNAERKEENATFNISLLIQHSRETVSRVTFCILGKMEALERATRRSARLLRDALHTFTNRVIRACDALGPLPRAQVRNWSCVNSDFLIFVIMLPQWVSAMDLKLDL